MHIYPFFNAINNYQLLQSILKSKGLTLDAYFIEHYFKTSHDSFSLSNIALFLDLLHIHYTQNDKLEKNSFVYYQHHFYKVIYATKTHVLLFGEGLRTIYVSINEIDSFLTISHMDLKTNHPKVVFSQLSYFLYLLTIPVCFIKFYEMLGYLAGISVVFNIIFLFKIRKEDPYVKQYKIFTFIRFYILFLIVSLLLYTGFNHPLSFGILILTIFLCCIAHHLLKDQFIFIYLYPLLMSSLCRFIHIPIEYLLVINTFSLLWIYFITLNPTYDKDQLMFVQINKYMKDQSLEIQSISVNEQMYDNSCLVLGKLNDLHDYFIPFQYHKISINHQKQTIETFYLSQKNILVIESFMDYPITHSILDYINEQEVIINDLDDLGLSNYLIYLTRPIKTLSLDIKELFIFLILLHSSYQYVICENSFCFIDEKLILKCLHLLKNNDKIKMICGINLTKIMNPSILYDIIATVKVGINHEY